MAKEAAKAKSPSKSEILASIADSTGLSKKQVQAVVDGLTSEINKAIGKKGPGVFALPGVCKITVIRKPATKATTKANPFKPGEMMEVKAKPARNVVKIRALKSLKDAVA